MIRSLCTGSKTAWDIATPLSGVSTTSCRGIALLGHGGGAGCCSPSTLGMESPGVTCLRVPGGCRWQTWEPTGHAGRCVGAPPSGQASNLRVPSSSPQGLMCVLIPPDLNGGAWSKPQKLEHFHRWLLERLDLAWVIQLTTWHHSRTPLAFPPQGYSVRIRDRFCSAC